MPEQTMTEDEALFAAALTTPDRTPWLALADWFDEHDEPAIALALREEPQLIPFLHDLARWDRVPRRQVYVHRDGVWHDAWQLLPAASLLQRYRSLVPVPPEAPDSFDPQAPPPRVRTDPLNTGAFLGRWQRARQKQIGALREQAARHADGRPKPGSPFGRVPQGIDPFEWRSCVVHELVVRERNLTPTARTHATAMQKQAHPLTWLPLHLLPVESDLANYVWRLSPPHTYRSLPVPATPPQIPVAAVSSAATPTVVNVIVPDEESVVFAAFRSWIYESNGTEIAAQFQLDRLANSDQLGVDWFGSLPTPPLGGEGLRVSRTSAPAILAWLFSAAQSGGAYAHGEWGAYGRLHAWQSFGWLAGIEETADADTIAAEAEQCEWLSFGGTAWFHQICWDLGLICIRPDRLSVAVLAATDTD
jgi:uncharacterized protein (TIGR02996 family)